MVCERVALGKQQEAAVHILDLLRLLLLVNFARFLEIADHLLLSVGLAALGLDFKIRLKVIEVGGEAQGGL